MKQLNIFLRRLLVFVSLLVPILASAGTKFYIGDLTYETTSASTVEVDNCYDDFTGAIKIPTTVSYNGVEYSVTSIGDSAFSRCSSLTKITLPNSVTSIGDYAFQYCSGLIEITLPNSVTSIGESAFERCSGLTEITIPNSVTSIGSIAFNGCSSLTEITIPNSVTSIGSFAFDGCTGLKKVTLEDGESELSVGYGYNDGYTEFGGIPLFHSSPLEEVYIGRNLSYGSRAYAPFSDQNDLNSVTIGNSVTSIGESAFYGCSSLTDIS
ncbi:MAG: leucine-rich repeat domain-containing protein, partial [Muribaculaceae bacterium]|nr:leucine-rich repeat domain-containing protein [Muribaculaceae bacterium]